MARVPLLQPADLPEERRHLLEPPSNIVSAMANSTRGAKAFRTVGAWIRYRTTIEPRLRELAILYVGRLTRCAYEWAHHIEIGLAAGLDERDIEALREPDPVTSALFSPLEQLVLRATRDMTLDGSADGRTVAQLRETLGAEQTVELVMIVSFYNGVVRLLESLAVDLEADFVPNLARHPLRDSG